MIPYFMLRGLAIIWCIISNTESSEEELWESNYIEVRYPNHTQHLRREPCEAVLLKTIEFSSGRKILYPNKIFCHKYVKSSLQELLLLPGFQQDCEHWRSRSICDDLRDVYNSNVLKKFQHLLGSPFLAAPFTYALMLNIDWFQRYTHALASMKAIYFGLWTFLDVCIINIRIWFWLVSFQDNPSVFMISVLSYNPLYPS